MHAFILSFLSFLSLISFISFISFNFISFLFVSFHSFIHSFTHSLVQSLIHSIPSLSAPLLHPLIHILSSLCLLVSSFLCFFLGPFNLPSSLMILSLQLTVPGQPASPSHTCINPCDLTIKRILFLSIISYSWHISYVPWSKVAILVMVIPPLIGILLIGI